jgi:indolepyruvate ferredoxin oxidoreductase beta subunit
MPADGASVLVVGVGGQGVVLASAVAADAARRAGFDVKQSEVHGMSQRGGVVSSHLRFGRRVHSPLIPIGEADAIVALEWNEALRALPALKPAGTVIINVNEIQPPSAFRDRRSGETAYPPLLPTALRHRVSDVRACDAAAMAEQAGNVKAMNSVLLGVLAAVLPLPPATWDEAIAANVPPKALEANRRAFAAGRALRFPEHTQGFASRGARSQDGGVATAPSIGELEIEAAWCKGEDCSICVRACPEYCLGFASGKAVRVVRADACTACGLCELLCPDFAITVRTRALA